MKGTSPSTVRETCFTVSEAGYPPEVSDTTIGSRRLTTWAGEGTMRVGVVSTFPPTRCGIANFTNSLVGALATEDPLVEAEVIKLVGESPHESPVSHPVSMEIDPSNSVSVRAAARHLNRCDVALINHEFGIFGPEDGMAVLDLIHHVDIPIVTVFHTVLAEPTDRQRLIVERLSEDSVPVVLCETAHRLLTESYDVETDAVVKIAHGTHWAPQPPNPSPRRRLITWGLLGPGKGLERALFAVAELRDEGMDVNYQIVGRTHPEVVRRSGTAYREYLQSLVERLGLEDSVEFIDRYLSDRRLFELIRRADLVLVPYDNHDQVSSGVLTEAIGIGRPAVATRFPYAEELLRSGAGIVVDHDSSAMAAAIAKLFDSDSDYDRAAQAAAQLSGDHAWSNVARKYSSILRMMAVGRASVSKTG